MKHFLGALGAALAMLVIGIGTARAGVVVGGTRVVLPAAQGEVTVRLTNKGEHPALVEAWIDSGDLNSTPDTAHSPFLITPPLFRMDPEKDQSLRIIYTQGAQPLPTDRESLFWLNVLEIPPKPSGPQTDSRNYLQFAIRSRLKLFYRPGNLPGDAITAPDKLVFKAISGSPAALMVHNPTPYYITIAKVTLGTNGTPVDDAAGMVAPYGELRLPLKGVAKPPSSGTPLSFSTIDDYGAVDAHESTVAR